MMIKEKLVSLRKGKGLSQLELAEALKVSRQAVSRWEVGLAMPSTDNLKVLSELYNVPVDFLLNDELDIQREERVPVEQIPKHAEETKRKVSKQAIAAVCFLLVAVILLICTVTHPKQNMGVTPIGEMEEDVIDPAAEEAFDIDW